MTYLYSLLVTQGVQPLGANHDYDTDLRNRKAVTAYFTLNRDCIFDVNSRLAFNHFIRSITLEIIGQFK